jgi:hypothetical protein
LKKDELPTKSKGNGECANLTDYDDSEQAKLAASFVASFRIKSGYYDEKDYVF